MKFGPGLPTGMEGLINPIPFFDPADFLRAAVLAEQLGYDSIWGNDHCATQNYVRESFEAPPSFYEVLTVLSAVSAVTSRIELGTAVLVMPMRDPVSLAKQVMTLDQLSGGRVILGVGIGAYREEYAAARPDLKGRDRGLMLEEGMALFTRLATERSVTHAERYYRTNELELYPKPARSPFPLLVGGHELRAIDRAVAYGQGWIPGWRPFNELREWTAVLRARASEAGRDPASLIVAPQLSCLIARTQEEAERRYMASGMVAHRVSLAKTGRDPAAALANNLIGSPETVLEQLAFLYEAGADHLACITFCVNSVGEYFEQLHFFAEEVMAPYRREVGIATPDSPPAR